MKTLSISQLRRDPVAALAVVGKGRGLRVTRRAKVVAELAPVDQMRTNPLFDAIFLKRHVPPRPRALRRGEAGVVKLLRQDRNGR